MAQYKVPQDVEADDKLLGPFSFRQFVYLMIAGGLIALAVGLFQLFPVLAIIPLPFIFLFGALALPLRKDQPMETYLVAIVSYYLKPKNQKWKAGQRESTIEITAPKIVEKERTRSITGEEATHRLSFLANIVDTGGQAIKGEGFSRANAELAREAMATQDMFEQAGIDNLNNTIRQEESRQRNEVIQEMRSQIQQAGGTVEEATAQVGSVGHDGTTTNANTAGYSSSMTNMAGYSSTAPSGTSYSDSNTGVFSGPNFSSAAVVQPGRPSQSRAELERIERMRRIEEERARRAEEARKVEEAKKAETLAKNPSIIELANNTDYSVATIAKEANRIKEKMEGEVFISLR